MLESNNVDVVSDFIQTQKSVFEYFNCDDNFFVKPLTSCEWGIKSEGDFYFLNYWPTAEKNMSAVIVKKEGNPMIFEVENYTMVIGIDCVKIGFVFSNENRIDV